MDDFLAEIRAEEAEESEPEPESSHAVKLLRNEIGSLKRVIVDVERDLTVMAEEHAKLGDRIADRVSFLETVRQSIRDCEEALSMIEALQ